MSEKYILIASRNEEDRTKIIIAYANLNPTLTCILSQSYTKEWIQKNTNINTSIEVIEDIDSIDLSKYKTICIDYIEVFNSDEIKMIVKKLMSYNIEIIAMSHMRHVSYEITNIFQKAAQGEI